MIPLISKREAQKILSSKPGHLDIFLDAGLSLTRISIGEDYAEIEKEKIPLQEFKKIKENSYYIIESGHLQKLAFFSDESNFYYKLMPTADWPTITLSSTPMHRWVIVSPKEDTLSKIKEISPVKGRVLDTCCGLGYTAIMSAKEADEVYTFEKDEYVMHIAKFNPYSQELFDNKKIRLSKGDICKIIYKLEREFFDRIVHDPPTFKYAPELYSLEFYKQLFRVIKKDGILYHYAPWPHRKGKPLYPRIIRNLKEAGFRNAKYSKESSGVVAQK